MLIGILSDTHGAVHRTQLAIRLLRERQASYFIHCGDVGGVEILDQLAGLPAAFVWGNCDYDRMSLERYAQRLGIVCYGSFGELVFEGKRIALMHGDDAKLKQRVLSAQEHDYLLQGHTHAPEDRLVGRMRLINPGALHRAVQKTVALLDTHGGSVQFLPVDISP